MSRPHLIDMAALRARLILAVEGAEGLQGSTYLIAVAAVYLAATPDADATAELGCWASLFELQARLEGVNGAELLATLANVDGMVTL